MWWYLGIAAICAAIVPWARKRSEGSMTRYSVGTGAPIVFVLIGGAAVVASLAVGSGDSDLAREIFTGGLIGAALAQFVLVRRTYGISLGKRPVTAETEPDGEPDPDADPAPSRTP